MERRCKLWLPKKNRFCANSPIHDSPFCGNHTTRPDGKWIPCPVDPSHNVLEENLKGHVKRCPFVKLANNLSLQPFYQKAINAGNEEDEEEQDIIITSQMKRNAVYGLTSAEASRLISKIMSVHASICRDIQDSYKVPEACSVWIDRQVDQKLPFQEKHVRQQASILGNLEEIGAFKNSSCSQEEPAVIEFGAGRGYLTQMLADCYGIKKVYLVERKSYKLKADRSLRQIDSMILERLRIDIEDLNLNGVESLKGTPYLAIGKHLCGPATDMTLRCCLSEGENRGDEKQGVGHCYPRGVAIATCCHYLCQWKHYISKSYMKSLGISKDEFNAITWFTSWAVDADHSCDLPDGVDSGLELEIMCSREYSCSGGAEVVFGEMTPTERAILGFLCKDIIDMGRLMWVKEHVSEARLVKYVPSNISPENRLLIALATELNH